MSFPPRVDSVAVVQHAKALREKRAEAHKSWCAHAAASRSLVFERVRLAAAAPPPRASASSRRVGVVADGSSSKREEL